MPEQPVPCGPLFVWRAVEQEVRCEDPGHRCVYCGEVLVRWFTLAEEPRGAKGGFKCYFCGWSLLFEDAGWCVNAPDVDTKWTSVLTSFDVDSQELTFQELSAALAHRSERALSMSPRQLEKFVADVYRASGYEVTLTAQTKDGGRDLILLRRDDCQRSIVEVKRYRNKVGVELVRQLRGVQLRDSEKVATLVAVSGFTRGAVVEANALAPAVHGFRLTLMNLSDLLQEAGLTTEPLQSTIKRDRDRGEYRRWFAMAHPDALSEVAAHARLPDWRGKSEPE